MGFEVGRRVATSVMEVHTCTIAAGASLSDGLNLRGLSPVAIQMPAGWDAAALTFQASVDGTTWYELYRDDAASAIQFTTAAGRYLAIDPEDMTGVYYLKVRSGTAGSPINQGADRVLTILTRVS